jgi:hypothetical protein
VWDIALVVLNARIVMKKYDKPIKGIASMKSSATNVLKRMHSLSMETERPVMNRKPLEFLANHRGVIQLPVLAATLLLGACASLGFRSDGPVAWETVDSDIYSGVTAEMLVTVRDQRTWSRLWAEHKGNRYHPFPLPRIDFSEEMIAGVFTGERPNGCHAVRIQRVYRKESRIIIEYSERIPFGPRVCNYAVTHPSHLIALPVSREPVEFIRTPDRPS